MFPGTHPRRLAAWLGLLIACLLVASRPAAVGQTWVGADGHAADAAPATRPATGPAAPAMTVDAATRAVSTADVFAAKHVGYGGWPSPEYAAFDVILAQPDAADRLDRLARTATPAGRLYGLLGLRRTDPRRYAAAATGLARSEVLVTTFEGCFEGNQKVGDVIAAWGELPTAPAARPATVPSRP